MRGAPRPMNRRQRVATGEAAPRAIRAIEMNDQKNTLLFLALSAAILIGWQIFFGIPQMEKQKQIGQQQPGVGTPQPPGQPSATAPQPMTRDAALAASPRVRIETPRLAGSLALKGGRIDDLALVKYRETVDPTSPAIVLLEPSGAPHPFYAEFGWTAPSGVTVKVPDENTLW